MKTIRLTTGMLILLMFLGINSMAQPMNSGKKCTNIPNLTSEQQTKLADLRTAHMKEMLNYRNQMAEKKAGLQSLRTADKADINAINKLIDEMGNLHTKMMKSKEKHYQAVRSILTDEQRVYFDSFKGNHKKHKGMKGMKGNGKQYGYRGCGGNSFK